MGMLANIRNEYNLKELNDKDLNEQAPLDSIKSWVDEAISLDVYEPTAMALATCGPDLFPSCRIVLLKEINEIGLVFFTNYESKKGKDISLNPKVGLTLFWKELERQIRIEGYCEKISSAESDNYFNTRPLDSRIGALTSPQSDIIENREKLEEAFLKNKQQLEEDKIKRPDFWGGYIVKPINIEFWQGRKNRLHDRILFSKQTNQSWKKSRLAP